MSMMRWWYNISLDLVLVLFNLSKYTWGTYMGSVCKWKIIFFISRCGSDDRKKCLSEQRKVSSPKPKLGRRPAGDHLLTSTLPSSSCCGAGRTWPTALLWLWPRKLGSQSQTLTDVLVGGCVRRARNLGLTCKCGDVIATDDKEVERQDEWMSCVLCSSIT